MSDSEAKADAARGETGDEPALSERMARTVTPPYRSRPDVEMTTVGWALFLGLVVLLLPLLPFLVVLWAVGKLLDRAAARLA